MDPLQILWVAQFGVQPNAGVKPHTHPYFHMFLVCHGQAQFVVADRALTLNEGQCLIVPPDTLHSYANTTDTTTDYMEIKFTLPKTSMHARAMQISGQILENKLANTLFKQILEEYSTKFNPADDAPAAYLSALLHALTEDCQRPNSREFTYMDASECSEVAQQVIRYLENHYAEDVSLDALAAALGYNKTYLCGVFKRDTNLTILDCLNTIRIRRAAELIVYSDHSLSQVSELCGFSSVSHFNRVFLKYVGTTPGQCRRAYPMDAIITPKNQPHAMSSTFMYSVLARKRITPQSIQELNARESQNASKT